MRHANLDQLVEYFNGTKTRNTLRRWAWEGYMPSIKLGLHDEKRKGRRYTYLFDLDEIDEWLESQKAPGRSERVPVVELV